ncbi:Ras family [Pelomyxa schiedti]|nr:Ras family [Pelomyxa schiedti]
MNIYLWTCCFSSKLKTLRLQLGGFGVKWLTERSESVDCDRIAAQHGINVCVIGASGTGKTCIAQRFIGKNFFEFQESTIGVGLLSANAPVRGSSVKLHIWDTSGRGQYQSVLGGRSVVTLLVYDITCLSSLNSLTRIITDIHEVNHVGKLLLCGNKADLFDNQQSSATACVASAETIVTYSQGLEFAKANHCDGFVEVSAKTMRNIPQLLTALGLLALEGAASPVEDHSYPLGGVIKKKKRHKPECALA